jgi:hypothetical protein
MVVEIEERRHQRPGRGFVDDPLPAKAEEVRHIHEEVRLRDPAIGLHRCKKVLEIARTFTGETALPNLIRTHYINIPVCIVWLLKRLKPRTRIGERSETCARPADRERGHFEKRSRIGRSDPSSKICSRCGYLKPDL